uniref:Leucine aminopeptidase 3 n=1 Tax=Cyprinus carpio TaxID=7962 RepID=A0A8C1RGN4_CYPCA
MSSKPRIRSVTTQPYGSVDSAAWQKGVLCGDGKNLARQLAEALANNITPTVFANTIEQKLSPFAHKVAVHKRPQSWIESEQMGAFLSVSTGSEEPPIFLELHYKDSLDSAQPPLVLVGTGITFDSGGISLKPSSGMDAVRADMSGRALLSTATAGTQTNLMFLISGLAPLCENMPSGKANKPDDVVRAKNGKTIQVFSSCTYCAMDVALGSAAAGMFTNSDWLWERLHKASIVTGDRVWRMPLFQHYTKQITESALAYLNNIGKYNHSGGFVTADHWAHLDIAGIMTNKNEVPYLRKGMSGRPTHTLVDFAAGLTSEP